MHEAKLAAAGAAADVQRLQRAAAEHLACADEARRRAEAALAEGREDLVAASLTQELRLRERAGSVSGHVVELQRRAAGLSTGALELQAKLDDSRLRLQQVAARESLLEAGERLDRLREGLADGRGGAALSNLERGLDEWEAGVAAREAVAETVGRATGPYAADWPPQLQRRLEELRSQAAQRGPNVTDER